MHAHALGMHSEIHILPLPLREYTNNDSWLNNDYAVVGSVCMGVLNYICEWEQKLRTRKFNPFALLGFD